MDISVSHELLARFSHMVTERTGLLFPEDRFLHLEKLMKNAAGDFGFKDAGACMEWLLSLPLCSEHLNILIPHLTIGETYFFRDKKVFEALEHHVLPEIIARGRGIGKTLRIWIAACSSGEEAYSVAILIRKLIPDLKKWNLRILATDINPESVQKAAQGIYGNWSFRDAPPRLKETYFIPRKDRFEILPAIKEMVIFSCLNLAENVYPSYENHTADTDLILCRNVLMYFSPDHIRLVTHRLHRSLAEKGWLIVSPGETSHTRFAQFRMVDFGMAIFYQKISEKCTGRFTAASPSSAFFMKENKNPQQCTDRPEICLNPGTGPDRISSAAGSVIPVQNAPAEDTEKAGPVCSASAVNPEPAVAPGAQDVISPENALSLYNQGSYAKAHETLLMLHSANPEDLRSIFLLARICANQGKHEKALQWCEKGLALDKLNADLYYLYAGIVLEKGDEEAAVRALNKTLYADPDFVPAHFMLGSLYRKQGRRQASERHFANVLSLIRGFADEDMVSGSEELRAGYLRNTIERFRIPETQEMKA